MDRPKRSQTLWRGLRRRCPVCGERNIWLRRLELRESCPQCHLRFERREGQFVGAVGINTIVTFALLLLTVVVGLVITWPDIAIVPMLIVGVAIAAIGPLIIHPIATTIWLALDLLFVPLEPGEATGAGGDPIDTPERPGQQG